MRVMPIARFSNKPHPSIRCSTAFRSYSGCYPTNPRGETFSQNQNALSICPANMCYQALTSSFRRAHLLAEALTKGYSTSDDVNRPYRWGFLKALPHTSRSRYALILSISNAAT